MVNGFNALAEKHEKSPALSAPGSKLLILNG
jgi:hypothetical protein